MEQDRNLVHPVAVREKVRVLIRQNMAVHNILREVPQVSRAYIYRQRRIVHPAPSVAATDSPTLVKAKKGLERAFQRFQKEQSPKSHEALSVARRRYESARLGGR